MLERVIGQWEVAQKKQNKKKKNSSESDQVRKRLNDL